MKERNFSAIYNVVFNPTESQDVKQHKKKVTILMQNQSLQQSFIETNIQTKTTTYISLASGRHMIIRWVDALKSINNTIYTKNLAMNCLCCFWQQYRMIIWQFTMYGLYGNSSSPLLLICLPVCIGSAECIHIVWQERFPC